jgi:fatty-acyl-CoA synthase
MPEDLRSALGPVLALSGRVVDDLVRGNLARFKVPRDVVFLDELPRNPTGKVLKRELVAKPPTGGCP